MTSLLSTIVAAISAAVGLLLAGTVASLAVNWYRISSFEGGAGYFVVGIALVGALASGVIGFAIARAVAAGPDQGFLKALGLSLGILTLIAGTAGGVARIMADVPPEVDGHGLFLAVELRWPAANHTSPASYSEGYLRLGSSSGGTVRTSEFGPLFVDLARQEEGRWIVPGVARIFTTRGRRVLTAAIRDKDLAGFLLPPKGNDNKPQPTWREWFPYAESGAPPLPDQFSYRFRVVRASDPVRTDSVGPFTIETQATRFDRDSESGQVAARSTFRIAHRGQPMQEYQEAGAVAVVGGPRVALLVQATDGDDGRCLLVTEEGSIAKSQSLGSCYGTIAGEPLTADPATYRAARTLRVPSGWVDRETFATPGLYLVEKTVLDTRTLAVHPLSDGGDTRNMAGIPPVSLSPDQRSLVWFVADGSDQPPFLQVRDWKADSSYAIPVDPTRMRFRSRDDVDPEWVAHHFAWARDHAGVDRLQVRERFTPLPYRGSFYPAPGSGVTMYSLSPGGAALRQALVDILIGQLGAVRQPDQLDGYHLVLAIGGSTIKASAGGGVVSFSIVRGEGDPALMTSVASTLDAGLATGRYDALFVPDRE